MAGYFDSTTLDGWLQRQAIPYFFTRQPLFRRLYDGGNWEVQHGKTGVQWRVRLSGSTIASYGNYATFTAAETGDFATAYLPWGSLFASAAISGKEMDRQGAAGSFEDGTLTPMHEEILRDLKDDFAWRVATQFTSGDGTALNAGTGNTILGYQQSVATSPSTGTYANISRVTVSDHRNQQFAATSGPSASAAQDAWWCLLNGKYQGMRQMGPRSKMAPDILIAGSGPIVMIKNKGFSQNTSLGANVKSIETVEGMEIDQPDDDATSTVVYQLCSKAFKIISTETKSGFFKLREVMNPGGDHVHEKDSALVIRTPDFQLVNTFPKANVAITSFS